MVIKKIGSAIIYIISALIIDVIAQMFGFGADGGGFGFGFSNIIIISIVLCLLSYNLRIIKIKAQNKGMESEEKAVFNDTIKRKVSFIVKTADFKIETILQVIISVSYMLWAFLKVVMAHGIDHFLAYKINILLIVIGVVVTPLYMAGLNLLVWYKAYNQCYKTKAY